MSFFVIFLSKVGEMGVGETGVGEQGISRRRYDPVCCFCSWSPPPYVFSRPPDVTHVMDETRPSPFSLCIHCKNKSVVLTTELLP